MINLVSNIGFTSKRIRRALVAAVITLATTTTHAMSPLHEAAMAGNVEFVKSWIANKRNLDLKYDMPSTSLESNVTRDQGVTALMLAVQFKRFEIVKLLVEGGANLYMESHWRDGTNPRTAFDYAAESGHLSIMRYLWEKSDGVHFARRLDTHIVSNCQRNCDEKFGSDANSNPTLFLISITRDEAMLGKALGKVACNAVQPLRSLAFLDRHAVRFPKSTLHCIAYHYAARHRPIQEQIAIATFLLDHGADPNDLPHTPLRGAAAAHNLEMVRLLLARGGDPNLLNADGITALGAAANFCISGGTADKIEPQQKAQLAMIEHLIQAGADAKLCASVSARSKLRSLSNCCSLKPQTSTQRRICEVFGL